MLFSLTTLGKYMSQRKTVLCSKDQRLPPQDPFSPSSTGSKFLFVARHIFPSPPLDLGTAMFTKCWLIGYKQSGVCSLREVLHGTVECPSPPPFLLPAGCKVDITPGAAMSDKEGRTMR